MELGRVRLMVAEKKHKISFAAFINSPAAVFERIYSRSFKEFTAEAAKNLQPKLARIRSRRFEEFQDESAASSILGISPFAESMKQK